MDSSSTTQTLTAAVPWLPMPSHWPGQGDLLSWCAQMSPGAAAVLILAGVIYLLFGYCIFRTLVTLNAAVLGGYIGGLIGQRVHSGPAGILLGAFLAAALAWPLLKYAVAIMGGVYGAILGAAIWRSVGLEPHLAWAGAGMGLIAFGLLSFIIFRGSVIMYTSLQGAAMLIFGLLGLIYKYPQAAGQLSHSLSMQPLILPMAIFIPAVFGLIYQQTQYPPPAPAAKK